MSCTVCAAPALPVDGACVFCRSPLSEEPDPTGLLDYLAARLPQAETRRAGLLRRGRVSRWRLFVAERPFGGRLRRGGLLELEPDLAEGVWVEELLAALSRRAAADAGLRQQVSRSGWALR